MQKVSSKKFFKHDLFKIFIHRLCHMTSLRSSSSNLFQLSIFCRLCRYLVRMVGASPPYRWINLFISHLLSRAPLAAFHFWLLLSSFLVLFFCGKWSPTLPLPCIISSQQLRRWANHSESSHRSTIPWMCPDWVMDEPQTTLGFHLKERSNR